MKSFLLKPILTACLLSISLGAYAREVLVKCDGIKHWTGSPDGVPEFEFYPDYYLRIYKNLSAESIFGEFYNEKNLVAKPVGFGEAAETQKAKLDAIQVLKDFRVASLNLEEIKKISSYLVASKKEIENEFVDGMVFVILETKNSEVYKYIQVSWGNVVCLK